MSGKGGGGGFWKFFIWIIVLGLVGVGVFFLVKPMIDAGYFQSDSAAKQEAIQAQKDLANTQKQLGVVSAERDDLARDYSHHPGVEESCSSVLRLFGFGGDKK